MKKNSHKKVVVVCSGHSGSRLLTKLLDNNGYYMGRYRGVNGHDEETWSRAGWGYAMRRAFLRAETAGETDELSAVLAETWNEYERTTFSYSYQDISHQIKHRFLRRKPRSPFGERIPRSLQGYGFKVANVSTFLGAWMLQYLEKHGVDEDVYFIYLTRRLADWLNSGHGKGTKGVSRPMFLPYANQFTDEAVRYIWFNNTSRKVALPSGDTVDLVMDSQAKLAENRIYLESLFWANSQRRAQALESKAKHFLHIKYEDLLTKTVQTATELSNFLGSEITFRESVDPARLKQKEIPKGVSQEALETERSLGYSG